MSVPSLLQGGAGAGRVELPEDVVRGLGLSLGDAVLVDVRRTPAAPLPSSGVNDDDGEQGKNEAEGVGGGEEDDGEHHWPWTFIAAAYPSPVQGGGGGGGGGGGASAVGRCELYTLA